MVYEAHVTGSVGDSIIGLCCNIVRQLIDGCGRGFCCACLLSDDFAECDDKLVVDRSRIVKECNNNALDPEDDGNI